MNFYNQSFIEDAVSKARKLYFDIFLPFIIPHVIIADSYEVARITAAPMAELVLKTEHVQHL